MVDQADKGLKEGHIIVVASDDGVLLRRVQRDNLGGLALFSNHDIGRPEGAVLLGRVVQVIRSFK